MGLFALSLGVSTMTVGCRVASSSEASRANDIVFTGDQGKAFELTQSGDLIFLDDLPAGGLAFYQELANRNSENPVPLFIRSLDDLQDSTVKRYEQYLRDNNVPDSDPRWARAKKLQGLVNLRRDISDPSKKIQCQVKESPPGFRDAYGVDCSEVWSAFHETETPQTGSQPFSGFYSLNAYPTDFASYDDVACMVEFRPPTAKLACGKQAKFESVATYSCAPVSLNGCERQDTNDPTMFPARLEISIVNLWKLFPGMGQESVAPRFKFRRTLGFAKRDPMMVSGSAYGGNEALAKRVAEERARELCPAGSKVLSIDGQPQSNAAWTVGPRWRYEAKYWCIVSMVQWRTLF